MQRPVILITGCARRLGREMALELAGAGYDIAVHYRNSAADAAELVEQLQALGGHVCAFAADLADEAACEALVPAVLKHFGRLDGVVNNASLFEYDNVDSFSYASMEAHWRANTGPAVLLARALHRHLLNRQQTDNDAPQASACVINVVDQKLWNPNPDYLSYTLSKAALDSCTTLLAQALAPQLRVCGIAPGVTLVSGSMNEAEFVHAHQQTPLRRSSTPADIARAVRFLLESPAITGTTLLVDGGQHLAGQSRDVAFITPASSSPKEN
jgi:NAD(P)-dependent dehydrogenase (short-subunit alcohol dehydrogenase family)